MRATITVATALLIIIVAAGPVPAQIYGPVHAELEGDSTVWAATTPVFETTEDAEFQHERYGRDFTYIFRGLPAGPARLKLGFCENRWTRRGERVFDVLINDTLLLDDFDILAHGEPNEAVVLTLELTIPATEPLRIRFRAEQDNAKINLVRIYTADWVMETAPRTEDVTSLQPRQRELSAAEDVWETQLGRLGSRVAINPRPQQNIWWQSPLGHAQYRTAYFDPGTVDFKQSAARYIFGVQVGDSVISMPFDDRLAHFPTIRQTETMTALSYDCSAPGLPVNVRFTWRAPFYPGDVKLSTAPYLTLEVEVTGNDARPQSGTVLIGRSLPVGAPMRMISEGGISGLERTPEVFGIPTVERWVVDDPSAFRYYTSGLPLGDPPVASAAPAISRDPDGRALLPITWEQPYGGLAWDFRVQPGETRRCRIVYVGWAESPVLTVAGAPQRFKYHEFFAGPDEVARYAFASWDEIEAHCARFERIFAEATVPQALRQFLAFATHSYLVNTWWTSAPRGGDFFSVWEGCCQLHSTVDVEYNVAPFYLALWPDLLRMELDQWVGHIKEGVLSHDMGVGLEVNGMAYWHPMEIEENTNFVLLLYAYWRRTGDEATVRRHYGSVRELLAWVTGADTDGDGFPEQGLCNTIDQGSAAIQYAPDQVYLAVRSMAAYQAGAQMAELMDEPADAERWAARVALTSRTLADQGWLDDHYVVALNQPPQAQATVAPLAGEGLLPEAGAGGMTWEPEAGGGYAGGGWADTPRPLSGWDSYSIYTTNGLVYPMNAGLTVEGIDLERMRTDLRNATAATLGEFGSPHTSHEDNMWVSQNIWRDLAAAYLGIDYIDHIERYWDVQRHINTRKFGAFTDVYVYRSDSTSLDYYPRGVAAYGLLEALAGLQFDRVRGVVSLAPLRAPLRLPLTMFAEWRAGTVPWLIIEGEAHAPTVRVEGAIPPGIEFRLRPRGEPFAEGQRIEVAGG